MMGLWVSSRLGQSVYGYSWLEYLEPVLSKWYYDQGEGKIPKGRSDVRGYLNVIINSDALY